LISIACRNGILMWKFWNRWAARFIPENSAPGGYEIIIKACHWSKGLAHSMEMDYPQKL